jgi:hypothetical protein
MNKMKCTKLIGLLALSMLFLTPSLWSQEQASKFVTCEIKVTGVCKMCKKRIENAALIKGVKFVEWNKGSQMLKVIYKPKNVTEGAIHNAIAEAGHDTEKVQASQASYEKLPKCCLYRDGVEVH